MGNLPALITSGDLLPGGGALNGRRWAGQQLLKSWAARSGTRPMALASPRPQGLQQLLPFLRDQGFDGELNGLDLLSPEQVIPWGGLFSSRSLYWSLGPMEATRGSLGFFAHWPNTHTVNSSCSRSLARPSE